MGKPHSLGGVPSMESQSQTIGFCCFTPFFLYLILALLDICLLVFSYVSTLSHFLSASCRLTVEPVLEDEGDFLYDSQPEWTKYKTPELSIDLVADWYWNRAESIENYSMQVSATI